MTSYDSVRISSLEGNHQLLDGGAMFGNAPRAVWEKWSAPDARGRIALSCRSMLIEWNDKKILCETGIGAYMEPTLAERYGVVEQEHVLLKSLHALGLDHTAIDAVILSHLHFDHAGGLLPSFAEGGVTRDLLFPRARYVVGQEAWQRALNPHPRDRASFIPGLAEKLMASGRLQVISGTSLPDVPQDRLGFRFSSGHTPGQMHTWVRGEHDTIFFAGDLIPGRAWVHLPITMGYDRFAEQVIDEKAELYAEAVPGAWKMFFTHDPEVATAIVEKDAKGRFVCTDERSQLTRYAL